MRKAVIAAAVVATCALAPSLAFAQRFPFQRTVQVSGPTRLDVSTVRGKIDVVAGSPGSVVVEGDVTVRAGWDVPANAVELARQVAASPPIEQEGAVVRLLIPTDRASQRAVTIRYRVQVPPDTEVQSTSNSGATSIHGIAAPVDVRTQSGAIDLAGLTGAVRVTSGSGAVSADNVAGALTVNTSSSGFTGTGLGSSLRVRTQSGAIEAALTGSGDVDVQTGSSAIRLRGVRGALTAKTQSGKLTVQGAPGRNWSAVTGSSAVDFNLESTTPFSLDASSRSGEIVVEGGRVDGAIAKRAVKGTVGGGGSMVQINTGSGSIRLQLGDR
jgi:DUF4097 and DUF4098 domain-containing protein YvlB